MFKMLGDVLKDLEIIFIKLQFVVLNLKISKWRPSRFQNGRRFKHTFDYYISTCELRIELKMVANGNTHVCDAKDYKKKILG